MKKQLLLICLLVGFGLTTNAQTEGAVKKMSIGAEVGSPTAKGTNNVLFAGGSVQLELPATVESFNFTLSAGYTSFFSTLRDYSKGVGFIPVKAGTKYYFGGNFYAAGEVGAAFATEQGMGTSFVFAPGLGASFSVADKSSFDMGLRFETWVNEGANWLIGLRAAYAFSL